MFARKIIKKNAYFGRYPSCDMLNNALRFLRDGKQRQAAEEIVFAINKADGYICDDVAPFVENLRNPYEVDHKS